MKRLLIATGNAGKVRELAALFPDFELVGLRDVDIDTFVDEDQETFEGNAVKKARVLAERAGLPALADDSGLEVDALDGAPGVRSARYAGEDATDADNVAKLLHALSARKGPFPARFRCVLALADAKGTVLHVEHGVCEGHIVLSPKGQNGFGYDPVFVPVGESRTMAELTKEEKSALSHRGAASRAVRSWMDRSAPNL